MTATRTPDPAPAAEQAPPSSRLGHLRRALSMSGTMVAALIAVVSAGLALFFQLRPDLLPDPRTERSASLEVFAIDDGVTLGGFLERRKAIISPAEYAAERAAYVKQATADSGFDANSVLTLDGQDVFVRLRVQGFKSRSVAMLASMYDANRRTRVPELGDVPVFQQRVEAPSDTSVVEFWMAAPPVTVRRYFIRVSVYHRGDGVLLAVVDSQPVRIAK